MAIGKVNVAGGSKLQGTKVNKIALHPLVKNTFVEFLQGYMLTSRAKTVGAILKQKTTTRNISNTSNGLSATISLPLGDILFYKNTSNQMGYIIFRNTNLDDYNAISESGTITVDASHVLQSVIAVSDTQVLVLYTDASNNLLARIIQLTSATTHSIGAETSASALGGSTSSADAALISAGKVIIGRAHTSDVNPKARAVTISGTSFSSIGTEVSISTGSGSYAGYLQVNKHSDTQAIVSYYNSVSGGASIVTITSGVTVTAGTHLGVGSYGRVVPYSSTLAFVMYLGSLGVQIGKITISGTTMTSAGFNVYATLFGKTDQYAVIKRMDTHNYYFTSQVISEIYSTILTYYPELDTLSKNYFYASMSIICFVSDTNPAYMMPRYNEFNPGVICGIMRNAASTYHALMQYSISKRVDGLLLQDAATNESKECLVI